MEKQAAVENIINRFRSISVEPDALNPFFDSVGSALMTQKQKLAQLVLRPGIGAQDLIQAVPALQAEFSSCAALDMEQAEIQLKYAVYIGKEKEMVARMTQMEDLEIPESFDFSRVQAISAEAKEKFKRIQPRTLGQASRISGINPSDIQILMVYMGR
jgi:tRNA uridine 5-carboxymethylaminomethyl modification enzyme